jgi:type VI secretion system protein ImpA
MSDWFDLEAIVQPISESRPAGDYLIYGSVYADLGAARSPVPGSRPGRVEPDWKGVIKIGLDALRSQTKDIQIGAYVAEALTWLSGLDGLRQGFRLFQALQDAFWPTLFPQLDSPTSLGDRLAPYEFMDEILPRAVYVAIPLTKAPLAANYNLQQFAAINQNAAEQELRNDLIRRTDPAFHQRLAAELAQCRAAFSDWRASCARLMVQPPPLDHLAAVLDKLEGALFEIQTVRPFPTPSVVSPVPGGGAAKESAEHVAEAALGDQAKAVQSADGAIAGDSRRDASAITSSGPRGELAGKVDLAAAAFELAAAGRLEAAIELIDGARLSARCRRDRFIRQLELVELCLARGLVHVARPLLEELAIELEARKLEEWEDPVLCSRVVIASVACLRASRSEMDAERVPALLERLYRLDPRAALRRDLKP